MNMAESQGRGKITKRVTNVDIVRRGGAYEFELTLDNAQEFVLKISTDEASTVMRGFQASESQLFDTEREELIFENFKS